MITQYSWLSPRGWLVRNRLLGAVCLAAILMSSQGCNKAATPQGTTAPAAAASPTPKIYPNMYPAQPRIISITPQVLEVHGGQASPARFTMAYKIINPELVNEAYVIVYSPGVGQVQRFDHLPVQAEGSFDFTLDPTSVDFGPTVRLRVHCPAGDTGWYILGTAYRTYPEGVPKGSITNVTPRYISRFDPTGTPYLPGGAVELAIGAGDMITDGCTAEAQIDGRAVELKNTRVVYRALQTLLQRSDIGDREVASRYLEVKMIVNGPKGSVEVIKHIDFSE